MIQRIGASTLSGWLQAYLAPKHWEGKRAWVYHAWNGTMDVDRIPFDFSRDPKDSVGVWYWLLEKPNPPATSDST